MWTAGVTGFAAWAGAVGLIAGALDLTKPIEHRLPLHSPVFGGIALAIVVAVPCTATTWMAWRHEPRAGVVGELSGWLLVGWILVEVAVIRAFSPLQPVCVALGVLLVIFGRRTEHS
jgi:Ca2+/Na+ antiporter